MANESDTAGTVKVEVQLPQDTPFRFVSTAPVPGWTAELTKESLPAPVEADGVTVTEAVRTVTWTADRGVQIGPESVPGLPHVGGAAAVPGDCGAAHHPDVLRRRGAGLGATRPSGRT